MLESKDGPSRAASALNLTVQGRKETYCGPPDVRSLLESRGHNSVYVNVRINGLVSNRRDFENIPLSEGDRVDFLYFMGGGTCLIFPTRKLNGIHGI